MPHNLLIAKHTGRNILVGNEHNFERYTSSARYPGQCSGHCRIPFQPLNQDQWKGSAMRHIIAPQLRFTPHSKSATGTSSVSSRLLRPALDYTAYNWLTWSRTWTTPSGSFLLVYRNEIPSLACYGCSTKALSTTRTLRTFKASLTQLRSLQRYRLKLPCITSEARR